MIDALQYTDNGLCSAGRFFAAMELKLIMVNLLLRYDMKAVPGGYHVPRYIGVARIPNYGARVSMRARR